ncbi:MAG: Holliday junction resolvase RuvX [Proteobacteria bacterium]|nr:Holliday junction resolvase RuvX [Pseudomonadota bacterium]
MIVDIKDLLTFKNTKTRLLGLDVGEKTIGLALSDTLWTIATGYKTLAREHLQKDVSNLQEIIKEYKIAAFVIGYPLNMNGSEGPSCERVQKLAEQFTNLPIHLWDERLSTVAIHKTMLEADLSRKKRAALSDKMAASFILQGALDRFRFL